MTYGNGIALLPRFCRRRFTRIWLLLAVCIVAAPASGQDGIAPAVVAVVDMQRIMSEAKAVGSVREQLDEISREQRNEIDAEEKRLRERDRELQSQRNLLAADVFAVRQQEFQDEVARLEHRVRAVRETLDKGFENTMARVRRIALEEIAAVAEDHGVDVVLAQSQIVVARNLLDITEEALDRLNKRLPKVSITAIKGNGQESESPDN